MHLVFHIRRRIQMRFRGLDFRPLKHFFFKQNLLILKVYFFFFFQNTLYNLNYPLPNYIVGYGLVVDKDSSKKYLKIVFILCIQISK